MDIEQLEELRKKAENSIILSIVISILISGILFIVTGFIFVIFIGIVIGIIISAIISNKPTKEFNKAFKNMFVLKALEKTFDNLDYNPNFGLDRNIIKNTNMMNMGDRYSSNDLISGTYKNINFMQADIHIEEEHETSDGNGGTTTTWVTIFKGRWMIFDFNKEFKANIQVRQKGFYNAKISNWREKTKYQKVNMEDQEFNNKFKIYAQSEHDAFYILTPSLMERIKNLAINTKGKLLLCFIDNKLHVGLHNNKDSFEHSIFKKINEQEIVKNIYLDIKIITDFIDELNLDNDLFKRKEV